MHGSHGPSALAPVRPLRRPFELGAISVDPATRTLQGPSGTVTAEPRIMQVLFALFDSGGGVVTRADLLAQCWDGMLVGDDALNRAIFELRRALRTAGADVTIETISKTGYRLKGLPADEAGNATKTAAATVLMAAVTPPVLASRRVMLGGLAGLVILGGASFWARDYFGRERRAADLVEQADIILSNETDDGRLAIELYRKALALTPEDALIWGKLALALAESAETAPPAETAAAVSATQVVANRALKLSPGQPEARIAMVMLSPHFGAWYRVDRILRDVLAHAPDNIAALANRSLLLMEVGCIDAASAIADQLVARVPLSPTFQYRHVYQLWATGRLREADQVADRALQLWPRHSSVWLARLWTFALTGRTASALAMIEDATRTALLPARMTGLLLLSCRALASRSANDVAAAVAANVAAARQGQFGVINAIMILPQLGAIDAAFEISRGYLLREGEMVGTLLRPDGQPAIDQESRRKTMPLWMPSAAPLRADPRFLPLCDAIGLSAFWQRSGYVPNFLKARRA